jgi:hypothetical protein
MKKHYTFILLAFLFLQGCIEDAGKVTVTYEKATAIYGDLSAMRGQTLFSNSRPISDAGKIFIGEQFLLVGEEGEGIHVFDNTVPENPVNVGFINIFGSREFYLAGKDLYAESVYDMVKIDLTDIRQPRLVTRVMNAFATPVENSAGEQLIGFDYETVSEEFSINDDRLEQIRQSLNNTIYLNFEEQLIPPSAVPTSFAGNSNGAIGTVNRIAEHNGYVYVIGTSRLSVFSTAGSFELVSQENIGWAMETVYPLGDRLFIGTQNSMQVYNISNPLELEWEGDYWHPTSCDPVLPVNENTAYVSLRSGDFAACPGDTNELLVLNVDENFGQVTEIQSFSLNSPYGMTLKGNRLYVGEGANGMAVFDASNPRNLSLINIDRSIEAYDIIPHPTRADLILIAGPEGFSQYEIKASDSFLFVSSVRF